MEKAVVYQQRLSKLRAYLNDKKTDVALISPGANLYYLTGLPMGMDERLQLLIIFADGRQVLVLPALYRNMVEQLWPASDLVVWDDQTKPEQLLLAVLGGCHRAAVDEQMWAGHLLKLLPILADADLIPLAEVLGEGRMHKDSLEIMKMEQSSAIVDQAFVAVLPDIKAGITEQQLAFRLEILCRELGAEEMNFSMVGFGKNGADPHHRPDNTPLTKNTMIVMDFGCKLDHYCSDITRTVCFGHADAEMRRVYDTVLAANQAAFAQAKLGYRCEDVDAAARAVINQAGYGQYFIHRTGHGIGLDCHEEAYIVQGNQRLLSDGLTFSIEPGIYLPGRFGVRIEDVAAMENGQARTLNHSNHALIELD